VTIVITGLAVVLVVIVSWIALRKIAAACAARQAVEREAEEDRLRSGEDEQ
jgi:flagellar biosynthesis/type III secretory pathway M-ring protein FliF/YscJ